MSERPFQDAGLILAAHGSTLNAGSGAPCYQHADELRRRRVFAEITEAFVQQDPSLAGALRRIFARRVFIVPLFISEGWFTERVVPLELGLRLPGASGFDPIQEIQGRTVHYCRAVGSHPRMTDVLVARARDAVQRHPFPSIPSESSTALVIAGHGTSYSAGSRESIEHQVALLRRAGTYAEVHGAYLEESPRVEEVWTLTTVKNIVLVPFFMSDGLHTREDIPELLGQTPDVVRHRLASGLEGLGNPMERLGKRLWYARAIGTEPMLADVILERVSEMAHEAAVRNRAT